MKARDALEEKIAEVRRALKAVKALTETAARSGDNPKDIETHFELSDGVYAKARIPPSDKVCLWLGANVMVEYTGKEATALLSKNLTKMQKNFEETCSDVNYIRDQLNTTDVNLSRVYNYHVQKMRGIAKASAAGKSGSNLSSKKD